MPSANYPLEYNEISALYQSVLQRTASQAEISAWATYLDQGQLTLPNIVSTFVTSTEAVSNVDPIIRLYQAFFGRAPDAAGLAAWVDAEVAGVSLTSISQSFAASAEFTANYGSTINVNSFLTSLYRNILGRTPDAAGLAAWTAYLGSNPTAAQEAYTVMGFAQSAEFLSDSATGIANWLTNVANSAVSNTTASAVGAASSSLYAGKNGATGTIVSGSTVNLTTGTDAVVAGTSVINGKIDLVPGSTDTTWTSADTINPSAGATMNVTVVGNAGTAVTGSGLSTTGVTTMLFSTLNNAANTIDGFNVTGIAGLTTVGLANSSGTASTNGTFTITNIPQAAVLSFGNNNAYETVNADFVIPTTKSTTGSSTTPTVTIDLTGGVGAQGVVVATNNTTGFPDVAIVTSGSNASLAGLGDINSAGAPVDTAITVTGSGGIALGGISGPSQLDNAVTKIDVTGETGNVVVNANVQWASTTLPGATLTATASIGGTSSVASPTGHTSGGTNTLILTTNQNLGSDIVPTGFQTILIDPSASSTSGTILTITPTIDVSGYKNVTTLGIQPGSPVANQADFINVPAADTILQFVGVDTTGSGSSSFAGAAWTLKTDTTTDSLTININNGGVATSGTLTIGSSTNGLIVSGIETVTVAAADASAVVINGFKDVDTNAVNLTFSGTPNVTVNDYVDGGNLTSVNASGLSGTFNFSYNLYASTAISPGIAFTGGSGTNTLSLISTGGSLSSLTAFTASSLANFSAVNFQEKANASGDGVLMTFDTGTSYSPTALTINDTSAVAVGGGAVANILILKASANATVNLYNVYWGANAPTAAGDNAYSTGTGATDSLTTSLPSGSLDVLAVDATAGGATVTTSSTVPTDVWVGATADTVIMSPLSSGAHILHLGASTTGSTYHTVEDASLGATGDVIQFSILGFTGADKLLYSSAASTVAAAAKTTATSVTSYAAGALAAGTTLIDFGSATTYTASTLQTLINGAGAITFASGTVPAGGAALLASYTAADGVHIAEIKLGAAATGTAAATVKDLVDLVGVSDAGIANANFQFVA